MSIKRRWSREELTHLYVQMIAMEEQCRSIKQSAANLACLLNRSYFSCEKKLVSERRRLRNARKSS